LHLAPTRFISSTNIGNFNPEKKHGATRNVAGH
jgi:hypothetical protein